jgi:hypothetical protein
MEEREEGAPPASLPRLPLASVRIWFSVTDDVEPSRAPHANGRMDFAQIDSWRLTDKLCERPCEKKAVTLVTASSAATCSKKRPPIGLERSPRCQDD